MLFDIFEDYYLYVQQVEKCPQINVFSILDEHLKSKVLSTPTCSYFIVIGIK